MAKNIDKEYGNTYTNGSVVRLEDGSIATIENRAVKGAWMIDYFDGSGYAVVFDREITEVLMIGTEKMGTSMIN